jgi:hypothetical protein
MNIIFKYIKRLNQDYINYTKNKTGHRDIIDLLENNENVEIIKLQCCYGSEEFADKLYSEILYNQRNNILMFVNLKNLFLKNTHLQVSNKRPILAGSLGVDCM